MEISFEKPINIPVIINNDVKYPIVICSHERSGTHFLMNSVAENFPYVAEPWLDFDLIPLGSFINFFSQKHVSQFFDNMCSIKNGNEINRLASIIKSHHESDFFAQAFANKNLRFIYMYRNPADTLISFWKFLHRWNWHEGRVAETPLEFASCAPEGQMMRYQYRTYVTCFDRWANHVLGWKKASDRNSSIMLVQYEKLKHNFSGVMKNVSEFLEIEPEHDDFREPDSGGYYKGSEITLNDNDRSRLISFVNEHIDEYPEIKNIYSL